MKNLAVLSNPPYTIGKDNTTWTKFFNIILDQDPDYFSVIVPIALLYGDYSDLRTRIVDHGLKSYRILKNTTFSGANVDTVIVSGAKGYCGKVSLYDQNGIESKIERTGNPVYVSSDKEFTEILSYLQKVKQTLPKFDKLKKGTHDLAGLDHYETPFEGSIGVLSGVVNQNSAKYTYVSETQLRYDPQVNEHKIAFKYSPTHKNDPYKTVTFGYEQPFYVEPGHIVNGHWYKYITLSSEKECKQSYSQQYCADQSC